MIKSLHIIFLLSVFGCATSPKLFKVPIDSIINSIKVTGEGRGRLSLEQGQYVFSYDAILKDEDWLLAVSVPLRGEEVMILPQIKNVNFTKKTLDSFETRLEQEIAARVKGHELSAQNYIRVLRSLVRFVLADHLSLKRYCERKSEQVFHCYLEEESFQVKLEKNKVFINKVITENYSLELMAENLTESFFTRTNFHLQSQKKHKNFFIFNVPRTLLEINIIYSSFLVANCTTCHSSLVFIEINKGIAYNTCISILRSFDEKFDC
jgi:hypothetical protein